MVQMEIPQVEEFVKELQRAGNKQQMQWKKYRRTWNDNLTRKEGILKDWRLMTICGWRTRISNQTNSQRSWTIKDTNLLGSQKTLVWEHFNWNFRNNGWFITSLMRTFWYNVWSQSSKDNMRTQHLHQRLSMKKKNIRWKKSGSTENKEGGHNTWFTGKNMEMNMINR